MRVLLITYYWPPAGGVAVQRWMKFARYIADEPDIDLVVYAPLDADYPEVDPTLEKEVAGIETWRKPIMEPYALFRTLTGKKKKYKVKQEFAASSEKGKLDNLAVWIRGNFFIPDARKFWIKPSVRFLSTKLKEEKFDCVISNGTPHSVHLIALALKRKFGTKWIADLRDPWTGVDYFNDLKLSARARSKHMRLEHEVLTEADKVVTVSPTWAEDLRNLGAKDVSVITNGFDRSDFDDSVTPDEKFTISHVGNFNLNRNKPEFWTALGELVSANDDFKDKLKINLVGMVDDSVRRSVEKEGLNDFVNWKGQVDHSEALRIMSSSRLLLLPVGDDNNSAGRIPAKVFEYMAANRPILALTPQKSDLKTIVESVHAGKCINSSEKEAIKQFLLRQFESYLKGDDRVNTADIEQFSRKALAQKMAGLIRS